jgi:hypothetical protein
MPTVYRFKMNLIAWKVSPLSEVILRKYCQPLTPLIEFIFKKP